MHEVLVNCLGGVWSGGAMVLGKLPVPGRPTIWITVESYRRGILNMMPFYKIRSEIQGKTHCTMTHRSQ